MAPPCHRPLSFVRSYVRSYVGTFVRTFVRSFVRFLFVFSFVRLTPEDGSDRHETLPKPVSDDSRHLIFRRPKNLLDEIFKSKSQGQMRNRSFWRSCEFLSVTIRFSTQKDPISPEDQISTFHGEGVQRRFSIFLLTFGPKLIYRTAYFFFENDDMMI